MAEEATLVRETQAGTGIRGVWTALRRRITKRLAFTIALLRIEAHLGTPIALLLIATIGRWPAALTMGGIMACYSAAFLVLLDGERLMDDVRTWAQGRRWSRRVLSFAERRDAKARVQHALAVPFTIMFMGPFWRAVTYHLFRLRRLPAYVLSVGGSIPHSLFWTGLVLGGLWEVAIRPLLERAV